jgi:hypothetical protein
MPMGTDSCAQNTSTALCAKRRLRRRDFTGVATERILVTVQDNCSYALPPFCMAPESLAIEMSLGLSARVSKTLENLALPERSLD